MITSEKIKAIEAIQNMVMLLVKHTELSVIEAYQRVLELVEMSNKVNE